MSVAPLVTFRIGVGLMLLISILRFISKGWVDELYIRPAFFFSYYGFEWVKPLGSYTYLLFAVCGAAAFCVAIGFYYRITSFLLFLSFTYIELMDKTTYLNHYYFVSLVCFLLMLLPANAAFSVDAWRKERQVTQVPRYTIDALRLLMTILYLYAGLAKINSDWLLQAQPLRTWLPAKNDLPVIGGLFNFVWMAYLFSWAGCIYDLSIPFLLYWKKTRTWAFFAVIVFHLLTAALFPIGMFPHIMIVSALIFFPASFHKKMLGRVCTFFQIRNPFSHHSYTFAIEKSKEVLLRCILVLFFITQLLFPFRYLLYPGELFWNEEGYRFSWRVMLMEKAGYTVFTIVEPSTGRKVQADNRDYLSLLQEKQMSFQPDMILEFAHFLAKTYRQKGWTNPEVYAESYVTLNGRPSAVFINPDVNLAAEKESFKPKKWVFPFYDTIQGF